MNDLRRIVALLLFLALVAFLVFFGPMLLAFAISRKGRDNHLLLWLFGLIALAFYGLKRLAIPRATHNQLPLNT